MNVEAVNRLCRAAFLRGRVVSFSEMGLTVREIGRRLDVPKSCVYDWLNDYERTGNFVPRRSTGRRPKTTERANRRLERMANNEPLISANQLNLEWGEQVSISTVYRRLAKRHIKKYRRLRRPMRTRQNCETRLRWATNHNFWNEGRWNRVLFTDESRFRLHVNDGRLMVWRKRGQRFNPRFISERVAAGGGSVHVWGAIWHGGKSPLRILRNTVNGLRYCDTLQTIFEIPNLPMNWVLQDDNARPHRCNLVNEFKNARGIRSLTSWPPNSPDLNPIEHLWDYIGKRVQARIPRSLQQLELFLQDEWNNVPQAFIDNLISSMRRRIGEVIVARGGNTRY